MSPDFRAGEELSREDARALSNSRSRAALAEHFGSQAKAERVWHEHADEVRAWCTHFTPIGFWAFDSGAPELADEVDVDPRLPEHEQLCRELDRAREAVLEQHPHGERWRSSRPLYDPTRRPQRGRKEQHRAR
jgi:hypothetical protein